MILFGSHAHGDTDQDSDFDFLVIEQEVEDRLTEAVRLRRALGDFNAPVDVIVIDASLAERQAKMPWSTERSARVVFSPSPEQIEYIAGCAMDPLATSPPWQISLCSGHFSASAGRVAVEPSPTTSERLGPFASSAIPARTEATFGF